MIDLAAISWLDSQGTDSQVTWLVRLLSKLRRHYQILLLVLSNPNDSNGVGHVGALHYNLVESSCLIIRDHICEAYCRVSREPTCLMDRLVTWI